MTADALDPYNKDITALIGGLPVCQMKDGTVITEQVQRLLQSIDLDEEGYPTITPIRGIRMWRGGSEDRVCTVVPNRSLRSPALANRRPKYRKPDERIEDAWGILEEVFPGIDRNYLTLLIAAKGVSESQIGLAPNIIVTGPSSAGKTSTAHIAAAILGDKATDVVWQLDTQKFRQAYAAGTEVGSFVTVNEILKDADRAGSTALQAMDAFLNLTPDSLTHKLYTGAVPLGRNPATIVTDVVIPQTLRNDAQVARRFIYVPLTRKINWINSLVASGVHKIERLRLADDRYAEAANAILSEVMDRWFQEPKTLADIAVDLGYSTLDKSETGFDDPTTTLKQFYAAWKAQSPSTDTRWAGGWRTLRRDDGTPLAELWSVLSDGGKNWDRSRRLSEQDWQQLLDSEVPIRVEFHRHGQVLGVRFV
jgi:hypothetical protein